MQKKQELEGLKQIIQFRGLEKIKEYFDFDVDRLQNMDGEALKHLYNMARLGMQFEKEMNLSKRAAEMNFVRVGKLVSDSKQEMKAYIKRTLPQYI